MAINTILNILIGLPASGKSTFTKKYMSKNEEVAWVSSDNIRIEHDYEINNKEVFSIMWNRTAQAALDCQVIFYDATNLSSKRRTALIGRFKGFCKRNDLECRVMATIFLQPLDVIKERNAKRVGRARVPEEVIDRMLRQFQFPAEWEGFDRITIDDNSQGALIPWEEFENMDQQNRYHTLTLGEHLQKAEEHAREKEYLMDVIYAAYYHDVGKYWTQTFDNLGYAHYYQHENVSAYWTALELYALGLFSRKYRVVLLVNYHMRPYVWTEKKAYERDMEKFPKRFVSDLQSLHDCDRAAH